MKISLSFTDLLPDEAARILDAATGKVNTPAPVSVAPIPTTVAPAAPVVPPMPQNVNNDDYEDDESDETPPASVELDADGLPWDERIHGTKKTKNADGRWRKRKGAENVEAIEAELKAAYSAPIPTTVAPAAPVPMPQNTPTPAPVAPAPMPAMPSAPAAPVVPPMPEQVAAQPAAPAPTGQIDGAAFMQHMTQQMNQMGVDGKPKVDFNYLTTLTAEIAQAFQVPLSAITDIMNNPQMITYAVQAMQRDGRW